MVMIFDDVSYKKTEDISNADNTGKTYFVVLSKGFKEENFELVNNFITRVLKADIGVPPGERLVHGGYKGNYRIASIGLVMVHIYTTHLLQ